MEKIILKSLELAGFKNAGAIADIIKATPNPKVATEMLLGIYEPKTVWEFGYYWKTRYEEGFYQVQTIDELNDVITCLKFTQKTEAFYYPTRDDYENKTNRVAKADRQDGVKYYDWRSEPVPGYTSITETFTHERFKDITKPFTQSEAHDLLLKWDPSMVYAVEPEMAHLTETVL